MIYNCRQRMEGWKFLVTENFVSLRNVHGVLKRPKKIIFFGGGGGEGKNFKFFPY